jgi:hypothetical protein
MRLGERHAVGADCNCLEAGASQHRYRRNSFFRLCRRSVIGPSEGRSVVTWSLRKAKILIEVAPEAIESVQQLADTWRAIVIDRGPGDVRDLPGVAIRWADSKFPFWNCITFNDQGVNTQLLDGRLTQAVAYMRQNSQPGLIWLFEDLLDPSAPDGSSRRRVPRMAAVPHGRRVVPAGKWAEG